MFRGIEERGVIGQCARMGGRERKERKERKRNGKKEKKGKETGASPPPTFCYLTLFFYTGVQTILWPTHTPSPTPSMRAFYSS